MSAVLPPEGSRVEAEREDGRVIVASVASVAAGAVWLSTPEAVSDGTSLKLTWGDENGARETAVTVYPSARKRVVFAKIVDSDAVERRSAERIRPATTILVRVEPIIRPDGMSDPGINGTIVDISRSGLAFTAERRLPTGTAVTVGFRDRNGDAIGRDIQAKIARFEHRDPRFLVAAQFEASERQLETIDEVLAACREGDAAPKAESETDADAA
jgi:hypothetical protein